MSPRAADNDGVIQMEGTRKKSSGYAPVTSDRLRAQPAILHYRLCRKRPMAILREASRIKR
jgi:hypothetical protein